MRVQIEATAQEIELAGAPLGSGGEAAVYEVPEQPGWVAKVYHKSRPDRADKLQAMLAAPPADPMAGTGHVSIAWPTGRLLAVDFPVKGIARGDVVGFVMPRVDHVRLIQEFYNPRSRLQMCPLFHYGYLLRTARNLAASVRALHEHGYVIGDLNESNLLVTNQALVTLVDTDSFQVPAGARTFRCPVGKPEYTPPELQGARFADIDRGPEHDAFGLAVLIFQLLMQGMHPFAGIFTGSGEPGSIPKRIAAGHFPYAQERETPFQPSPHAPPWAVLPPSVQAALRRCFEEGHAAPASRPNAADWYRALHDAEKSLTLCPINSQHLHHHGLDSCPWCTLARQQGRDPFPAAALPTKDTALALENAIPIATPAETTPPSFLKKLARVNFLQVLKWTAATVGFVVAAVAVAYGSWRLTHKPRLLNSTESNATGTNQLHDIAPLHRFVENTTPDSQTQGDKKSASDEPKSDANLEPMTDVTSETKPKPKPELRPEPKPVPTVGKEAIVLQDLQAVDALAFSADKKLLFVASMGKHGVYVWSVAERKEIRRLPGMNNLRQVCFSSAGNRALTLHDDSSLQLWNLENGQPLNRLNSSGNPRLKIPPISQVALSADGMLALAVGPERMILWDFARRISTTYFKPPLVIEQRQPLLATEGVALLPAGNGVWVCDLKEGNVTARLPGMPREFANLAMTPDGKRLLSSGIDDVFSLWNVAAGKREKKVVPRSHVAQLCLAPDGRFFVHSGLDRNLHVRDADTGKELYRFEGHAGVVTSLALSSDGRQLVSASSDNTVRIWNLPEFLVGKSP